MNRDEAMIVASSLVMDLSFDESNCPRVAAKRQTRGGEGSGNNCRVSILSKNLVHVQQPPKLRCSMADSQAPRKVLQSN